MGYWLQGLKPVRWPAASFFSIVLLFATPLCATEFQTLIAGNLSGAQVALDSQGNFIIAGTAGYRVPATQEILPLQPPCSAGADCPELATRREDVYVVKISPDGRRKLWERMIGGSGPDFFRQAVVDTEGNIYLLIQTLSPDFPAPGASAHPGNLLPGASLIDSAGVIVKLASDGSIAFAEYANPEERYILWSIRLNRRGDLLFTGSLNRHLHSTVPGFARGFFTGRIAAGARSVALSSIPIGGQHLATDSEDNVILTGSVAVPQEGASPIPTSENALQPAARFAVCGGSFLLFACSHQFVAKLSPDLERLVFSTYLAGNRSSGPAGPPVIREDGSIVVYGSTDSTDYPAVAGAFIDSYPSKVPLGFRGARTDSSGFLSVVSADGSQLLYSTFIGGAGVAGIQSAQAADDSTLLLRGETTTTFVGLTDRTPDCRPRDERLIRDSGTFFGTPFEMIFSVSQNGVVRSRLRPDFVLQGAKPAFILEQDDSLYTLHSLPDWTSLSTPGLVTAQPGHGRARNFVVLTRLPKTDAAARPELTCIEDTANFQPYPGRVLPGQALSLFVNDLPVAPAAVYDPEGAALPLSLNGVEVWINGQATPLVYVSRSQLNVVPPLKLGEGAATLEIRVNGETVIRREVTISQPQPGIFLRAGGSCGYAEALVLFQDGTPANCQNRATSGDILSFFLNGLGLNADSQNEGEINHRTDIGPPASLHAGFSGLPAEVLFFGPAIGLPAGIWKVDLRVPELRDGGRRPVQFFVNGRNGPALTGNVWVQ